ncbi:MAG: hypothetical protein IJ181_00935 [Acidaminococcaceae bacterium]|nr:hypothetical protein [Acidaminococcaceae bacterium]
MTRKWLEGAAGLRQETVTKSFTKSTGKRADELISGSLITNKKIKAPITAPCSTAINAFVIYKILTF